MISEAVKVPDPTKDIEGYGRLAGWLTAHLAIFHLHDGKGDLDLITPRGSIRVTPGEWIIRDVTGEFHVCKERYG